MLFNSGHKRKARLAFIFNFITRLLTHKILRVKAFHEYMYVYVYGPFVFFLPMAYSFPIFYENACMYMIASHILLQHVQCTYWERNGIRQQPNDLYLKTSGCITTIQQLPVDVEIFKG